MGIVGLKHKKRYRIRCADCGSRVRVAHPLAIYCSDACKQHAARKRRDAREKARRRETAQREAERQRREAEAEAKAEAERLARIAKAIPTCPECGKRHWRYHWDKRIIGGWRLTQTCIECGHTIHPTTSPCPCPKHSSAYGTLILIDFETNGEGVLTCGLSHCGQKYEFGEWLTNWGPGQAVSLAPGHTMDTLKHQQYLTSWKKRA